MKALIYTTAIFLAAVAVGCRNGKGNLSLKTTDTNSAFKFEARYNEDNTDKLEQYLDSTLNNELPLDQNIDLFVNLNGTDKFNLKAQKGWLEINFDKKNSSLNGYLKLKKITEGIGAKLTEK